MKPAARWNLGDPMKIFAAILALLFSASVAGGQPLSSYPSAAPSAATDYVPILRPCTPAGVGACPATGWVNYKTALPDAVTGGGGAPLQSPNLLGDVSIAGKLVVGVPTQKVAMGTDATNANLLIGLPGTATPYMDWRGAGVMSGYSVRFILDALNELHMIGPAGYASLNVTGAITTGKLTTSNVLVDQSAAVAVPINAATVTIAAGVARQVINPATALATLTIGILPSPSGNATNSVQPLAIIFMRPITSVLWASSGVVSGATLPSSVTAGTVVRFEYVQGIGFVHVLQG